MLDRVRALLLRRLRVPLEPTPPPGDPATTRVFRAAPAFFRYRLIGWVVGQLGTLVGLTIGALFLAGASDRFVGGFMGGYTGVAIAVLGAAAWIGFLLQIPFGFVVLRLNYELRWYMLSDRALRIREGILSVRERTMTFANIQQIAVRQNPIQRLLGIADVEVRTAGGGGSSSDSGSGGADLHRGYLRGVADAEGIRDTIRERVRLDRQSDAGAPPGATSGASPLRHATATTPAVPSYRGQAGQASAMGAAHELLGEVRALRRALTG